MNTNEYRMSYQVKKEWDNAGQSGSICQNESNNNNINTSMEYRQCQ